MNDSSDDMPTEDQLTQWGWPPSKPEGYWENLKKQQIEFMLNPPPCGETVEFRMSDAHDGMVGSIYWFNAADVQATAEKMIEKYPQMTGLRSAAQWTSLRDVGQPSPSLVSPLLSTFRQIAFELVEAGKGQVTCPQCKKLFLATELEEGFRTNGGYTHQIFSCPEKHELINVLNMHILFKDYQETDSNEVS
jgi:hypothetical protein